MPRYAGKEFYLCTNNQAMVVNELAEAICTLSWQEEPTPDVTNYIQSLFDRLENYIHALKRCADKEVL